MILESAGLLLLALVATTLLWPLFRAALRQRRVHAWPQVAGVVTAHRLRQDKAAYFPEHEVRFHHDGRETVTWCGSPDRAGITGHHTPGGTKTARPDLAGQRILDQHPVGTTVRLRVNPSDHAEVYRIEREMPLTLLAALAAAAFAGLVAVAISWIRLLH